MHTNMTEWEASEGAAATTATTETRAAITLTKVAADYKLQPLESFLVQGREKVKGAPYFHTVQRGTTNALIAELISELLKDNASASASARAAVTAAISYFTSELLKDKAQQLATPGSSITINLSIADIIAYLNSLGTRTRTAMSGADIDAFTASKAMLALAEIHGWTASQQARVAISLRSYAAPTFKHSPVNAETLLSRLEPMQELLAETQEDAEVYHWLCIKLRRDANINAAVDLADSI